jgi:hypothetical protein
MSFFLKHCNMKLLYVERAEYFHDSCKQNFDFLRDLFPLKFIDWYCISLYKDNYVYKEKHLGQMQPEDELL